LATTLAKLKATMSDRKDLGRVEREYRDQGYSVVEGVFSAAECLAIRKVAEQLASFRSGSLLPVMNPHREQPELLATVSDKRIVSVVRQLMDGTPEGLQTQYFFCRPGTRGFSAHQDNYYVRAGKDKFLSAWLALEDVQAENGALVVLPGSHREPVLEVREIPQPSTFGQDPNHNCQECVIDAHYPKVSVAVREGGVIFLHSHLVHSSNDNITTDKFRRALLITYLAKGAAFRPGFIAQRAPFALSA
jgi:ectoine hydroxylase-related dioxygenase (phytanoyl-CoA dioxygenase family)